MDSRKAAAALAPWLLLVTLCATPLAYRLFYPFVTMADNNSAAFAQPARNYLRHGLMATRLGMAYNTGDGVPTRFAYNSHHPPLAAVGTAVAFLIFGVADWSSRLYPASCSIGSALLLFALWRRHRGPGPAALAAAVMATLPAFGHFGKMLGEEAPTLFFGLLTILMFERWRDAWARSNPHRVRMAFCLFAYTAGCLSGWAAFYLGPILMGAALATLPRGFARRRALAGLALTGLIAFAAVAGHVAYLTGSLTTLLDAARGRALSGAADFDIAAPGRDSWLQREATHFARLYGPEAGLLALVGALAAVLSARRRPLGQTPVTLATLVGLGLAHPLVFRWAAYIHDWLLFDLLPIISIGVAEGILLLAAAAAGIARTAKAPTPIARLAALAVISAGLVHRAALCARDLQSLAGEQPRYGWSLLGKGIARLSPGRSHVMANFPFLEPPLRFYADRPSTTVTTADRFESTLPLHDHALYIRDMNIPIDADLERLLDGYETEDLASYRLYRIGSDGTLGTMPPASEADTGQGHTFTLDARFSEALELVECAIAWPAGEGGARSPAATYLGLSDPTVGRPRVVSVTSSWRAPNDVPPRWRLFVAMPAEPETAGPALPLVQLTGTASLDLERWRDRQEFTVRSAFLITEAAARDHTVRFAISDGGMPVTPRLPGPSRPQLKSVVVGPISLPAAGP